MTEGQLFLIGIVAMAIVWGLKLFKADVKSGWLTVGVYVIALPLAWYFAPLSIPPFPACNEVSTCVTSTVGWVGDLLVPLSAFVGFATLVYNALMKNILDNYVKPAFARFAKK